MATRLSIRCRSHWPGRPDKVIEATAGETLYEALRAADQPIASSCTAESVCGRCVVEVLEGADSLPLPSQEERTVLRREGAGRGCRLACRLEVEAEGLVVTTGYW